VQTVQIDLADPETLTQAMLDIDAVVFAAGKLFAPDPKRFLPTTNTQYVKNALEAAVDASVPKFILLSFPHVEENTTPQNPGRGLASEYSLLGYFDPAQDIDEAFMLTDHLLNLTPQEVGELLYHQTSTGRGLIWSSAGSAARVCAGLSGTKIQTALNGSRVGTIEAVVDVVPEALDASRLVDIGVGLGGDWVFTLAAKANMVRFAWNSQLDSFVLTDWPVDLAASRRVVLTLVFDSELDPIQPATLYVNGNSVNESTPPSGLPVNIAVPVTASLCIGNRPAGSRSPSGTIYYAAIYDRALDSNEVLGNAQSLFACDDRAEDCPRTVP